ncbi:MAG: GTPase ObgE [Fimbriimonadales bacterium]
MFLDEATIDVRSGKGGSGVASFRREKHVPRGGPDGGDGGDGGDVVLIADKHVGTLLPFRYKRKYAGDNGADGEGNKRFGKTGKSVKIAVPIGTVVKDAESGEILADLTYKGARYLAAKGGRGGRGNLHFVNSVRQAPTFAEKGEPAEGRRLLLELKLMADVGLVGLPNAGKSTLISAVSAAKPKIADYPFTTLEPNLGIAGVGDVSFTIADLPGLIEGAADGRGLGHRFLKHAERTRIVCHLVECLPVDESDPIDNFAAIAKEVDAFSKALREKPVVIVMSKIDLVDESAVEELKAKLEAASGLEVFPISAATQRGLEPLLFRLAEAIREAPDDTIDIIEPKPLVDERDVWEVVKEEAAYAVQGRRIERLIAMTDLSNDEALRMLHRKLMRIGVIPALRDAGAEDGDTVRIGEFAFVFVGEDE